MDPSVPAEVEGKGGAEGVGAGAGGTATFPFSVPVTSAEEKAKPKPRRNTIERMSLRAKLPEFRSMSTSVATNANAPSKVIPTAVSTPRPPSPLGACPYLPGGGRGNMLVSQLPQTISFLEEIKVKAEKDLAMPSASVPLPTSFTADANSWYPELPALFNQTRRGESSPPTAVVPIYQRISAVMVPPSTFPTKGNQGPSAPAHADVKIIPESVKIVSDQQASVSSKLEKVKSDVTALRKAVGNLEHDVTFATNSLQLVQENLRGVEQKHLLAEHTLFEKEQIHDHLLKEFVDIQWRTKLAEQEYQILESKYVDFQVEKVIRGDQVQETEKELGNPEATEQLNSLISEVKSYQDFQDRLDSGDPELRRILSGDALLELEIRKNGLKDAFARREARVEGIYVTIDEKKEKITKVEQEIRIKENQNKAKLLRMQRELQDKQTTESHLKQTAEYLQRQIDPALGDDAQMRQRQNSSMAWYL